MPAVRLAGAWVCSMGDGGFGGGESRVRYAVVCFKLEFIAIIDHVPWLIESLDCGGGVVLFAFCCFLGSTTYVFCLRTRTGPNLHCGMQCVFDWAFPKGKLNRLFRSWSRVCGKPCLQSRAQYVDRLWRLWLETPWWTLVGAIANRYTMRDICDWTIDA